MINLEEGPGNVCEMVTVTVLPPGRCWASPGAPSHPREPSSYTFVLSLMEPLLPETAEGGDARAGSDEDARTGAILRKLEAAGTEGTEGKKSCPQTLWV